MVFESVVVDVLNRFLGDYVVNLDTSQLSLGIWGGAVALKNLEIKENALSQLDVPFKIKVGHIDMWCKEWSLDHPDSVAQDLSKTEFLPWKF